MALRTKLNTIPAPAPAHTPEPPPTKTAEVRSAVPKSRQGKAQVAFFVERTTKRQLETIAFNEQKKLQALMLEACNLLFQSRGMTRTEEGDDR